VVWRRAFLTTETQREDSDLSCVRLVVIKSDQKASVTTSSRIRNPIAPNTWAFCYNRVNPVKKFLFSLVLITPLSLALRTLPFTEILIAATVGSPSKLKSKDYLWETDHRNQCRSKPSKSRSKAPAATNRSRTPSRRNKRPGNNVLRPDRHRPFNGVGPVIVVSSTARVPADFRVRLPVAEARAIRVRLHFVKTALARSEFDPRGHLRDILVAAA
jgi:hypothetical protein